MPSESRFVNLSFGTMSFDIQEVTEEWLISFCQRVELKERIGGHENGKQVFKISDSVVVKLGHCVTAAEGRHPKVCLS